MSRVHLQTRRDCGATSRKLGRLQQGTAEKCLAGTWRLSALPGWCQMPVQKAWCPARGLLPSGALPLSPTWDHLVQLGCPVSGLPSTRHCQGRMLWRKWMSEHLQRCTCRSLRCCLSHGAGNSRQNFPGSIVHSMGLGKLSRATSPSFWRKHQERRTLGRGAAGTRRAGALRRGRGHACFEQGCSSGHERRMGLCGGNVRHKTEAVQEGLEVMWLPSDWECSPRRDGAASRWRLRCAVSGRARDKGVQLG